VDEVRTRLQPYYWIIFAVLLQGLSPVLTKYLLSEEGLSPTTVVATRYGLAVLFLAPLGIGARPAALQRPRRKDWIALLFVGGFGSAIGALLFTKALDMAPAGVVNALSKTAPIFVAFIAYYALRERITSLRFTLVFVMVGADVLIGLAEFQAAPPAEVGVRLAGDALALLAGLSRALAEILSKGCLRRFAPTTVAFARFGVGAAVAAIACTVHGGWRELILLDLRGWLVMVLLASVCTSLSMSLYLKGLARAQAHVAVSLRLLGAIVTVIFSWALLGERLDPLHVAGIGILVFTAYVIVMRTAQTEAAEGEAEPAEARAEPERVPAAAISEPWTPAPVRLSLKLKIATVLVLVVFITMFTTSYLSLRHTEQVVRKEIRVVMGQIAANLAQLQVLPDRPTRNTIQQYADRIVRQDITSTSYSIRVIFIAILDQGGHVTAFAVNPKQLELADESGSAYRRGDMRAAQNLVQMADRGQLDRHHDLVTAHATIQREGRGIARVVMGCRRSLAERPMEEVRSRAVFLTLLFVLLGILAGVHFAGTITGSLERLARAMRRVQRGDLDVAVVPEGNDEIEDLSRSFNEMVDGLRVRDLLDSAFSAYVSRQVAERIVARREIVLEPARRKVTVMFSDIRGFTPMAERLGPQEIFEVLNEYFDVIIQIVFRYDGILDKYIGDCIMAVWGAFGEEKDDALRAVMAAVEMKQTLTALNRKRVEEGKEPIRTGFGLNTGEVTAGSLGALGGDVKRMEYAVVGDPVNLAQRIESHTPSTGLLISESTYAEVAEHVIAREGPPLTVKGKPTKVPVYLVLGLRDGELIYDDDELSEMGLTRARAEQLMSAGR
jgi:class 3 adenylate cyclase/drug/metabolite transporter (DMT)-like permease